MVIALEGLPAAGKTTAAENVARLLGANALKETTGNHPFLSQVYDDADRDDLTVELAFLVVHANPYRRLARDALNICDFSPVKDILFAEDMLYDAELSFFRETYTFVYDGHPRPDLVVYMRIDPRLALRRAQDRMRKDSNRRFEAGMTYARLARMEDRYEAALSELADAYVVHEVSADHDEAETAIAIADLLRPYLRASAPTAR
jgi:deoxyadenosine/deoxycytidine kinase